VRGHRSNHAIGLAQVSLRTVKRAMSLATKESKSSHLTRIFRKRPGALINTLLQRGVTCWQVLRNRFNGFSRGVKTVETVSDPLRPPNTPLKRGVNEKRRSWSFSWYEAPHLTL